MSTKNIVAIVGLSLLAAGVAQAAGFEQQASETVKSASQGAHEALCKARARAIPAERNDGADEKAFASVITCAESEKLSALRLFTRLQGVRSLDQLGVNSIPLGGASLKPGETRLLENRAVSISRSSYRYSVWTCETDISFSFDASSLLRRQNEKSRRVPAHVEVLSRGTVVDSYDLACTAHFN